MTNGYTGHKFLRNMSLLFLQVPVSLLWYILHTNSFQNMIFVLWYCRGILSTPVRCTDDDNIHFLFLYASILHSWGDNLWRGQGISVVSAQQPSQICCWTVWRTSSRIIFFQLQSSMLPRWTVIPVLCRASNKASRDNSCLRLLLRRSGFAYNSRKARLRTRNGIKASFGRNFCQLSHESFGDEECFFWHGWAPCHTTKAVTKWISERSIHVLGLWLGNSRGLSPVENLWSVLRKGVEKQKLRQCNNSKHL